MRRENSTMKVATLLGTALLIPGTFLVQTTGGSPVAVVDLERAMVGSPDGKKAMDEVSVFVNTQRAAIEKRQKEADDLENKIRTQGRALSEAARARLSRDLDTARTAVTRTTEDAERQLDDLQRQVIGPVEDRTIKVVRDYAAERAISIVFDLSNPQIASGIIYFHDTADITTEIIRRLANSAPKPGALHGARFVSDKYQRASADLIQDQIY